MIAKIRKQKYLLLHLIRSKFYAIDRLKMESISVVEVDQCFISTDPNTKPEEFFEMVEQEMLNRIRKMEGLNASLESIEE